LALVFIFVDHISDNFLSYFTVHSISFSKAAEIFSRPLSSAQPYIS
jgi:hypothetical protein